MEATAKTFDPQDTRPLKVYFQDEARFGRMHMPRRCWAQPGCRPEVRLQQVREYTYVYSAVSPSDGENFSFILPWANTEMMEIFLKNFADYTQANRVVMVMDQASWHRSKTLQRYDNIRILFQPPYSPELNPAEHLWEHLRENYMHNHYWANMEDLEEQLVNALSQIAIQKQQIQSLVAFPWIFFHD